MAYLDPEYMKAFRAARPSAPAVLKWIEALRSGNFTQFQGGLCSNTGALCCLGVAAKINDHDPRQANTPQAGDWLITDLGFENGVPETDQAYWWTPFSDANDDDGWSFEQIADWLEQAINLQRTIDLLKALPDERFDISVFRQGPGSQLGSEVSDSLLMHECGTAACVAGWAAVFDQKRLSHWIDERAKAALGLDGEQARDLFFPPGYETGSQTRERAIRVLENFRDTGVINWSLD